MRLDSLNPHTYDMYVYVSVSCHTHVHYYSAICVAPGFRCLKTSAFNRTTRREGCSCSAEADSCSVARYGPRIRCSIGRLLSSVAGVFIAGRLVSDKEKNASTERATAVTRN